MVSLYRLFRYALSVRVVSESKSIVTPMVSFRLGSPSGYVQGGTTRCCNHDLEQLESLLLVNRSDPT